MGADEPVGRGAIRASLGEALDRALHGRGTVVTLTGEPGIGKTTMARDVADRARRVGASVRWAACWAGGATVAHGPWLTVLSGLGPIGEPPRQALAGTTSDGTAAAASARATAYASVATAFERASRERPLVVVLDDLQWADEGTVQLLGVVAGHVPAASVLVVATYRDTEVAPGAPLTRLTSSVDRFELQGLDVDGVAALLNGPVGRERAAQVSAEVHRRTGGNPFLVVQLARLLGADPSGLETRALTGGARDLLEGRLAALPSGDRSVLAAAAVLGGTFTMPDLAALLERTVDDVAPALERAATLRIIERSPGVASWGFAHDLFREATLAGVGDLQQCALHRKAASLLERAGAEPATIAHHLFAADGGRSIEAARWSVRAGSRAISAFAWEEAVAHYERALAALESGAAVDVRADALLGLGRARLLVGDAPSAGRAFEDAAALARRDGSPELLARAALGFSIDLSGFEVRLFDQRQIDLLEEAASMLEDAGHDALRATVLARLSVALSMSAPGERRLRLAETAVELARRTGAPVVLGRCLAAHCDAISGPENVDRRLAEATEIVAIGEREGDGPLELLGRRLRFVALLELGRFKAADDEAAAYGRRADAVGNPLYAWYVPLWAGQRALIEGKVDACDAAIDEARTLGRAAGSINAEMLCVVLGWIRDWTGGDYAGAVRGIDTLARDNPELMVYLAAAGGWALSYALAGRTAEAVAVLDRCQAAGIDSLPFDAEWLANVALQLDVAATLEHPLVRDLVNALRPYAHLVAFEGIGAGLHGSVARFVAMGCSVLGEHDDAVAFARTALEVNSRAGGLLAADAMRSLARCLERRGTASDLDEAAQLHARAADAYAAAGAMHQIRARDRRQLLRHVPATSNELRRDGDVWHMTFGGTSTIVKHGKGVADLSVLLAAPGREFHVTELETVPRDAVGTGSGDALDRRAVAAYRQRLTDLAEDIDEAQAANDVGRVERLQTEYDTLVDELTRSLGLRGRTRTAGAEPVERLRKAVSARIRDAIRRIEGLHPALGRHLSHSVRTGTFCSYQPEDPVDWRCQT